MKEKDEKKANAEQKKKNVPDRREKETRQVFSTPCFFCPFLSKSKSSSKSARSS
jgi:hypothetical protein